MIRVCSILIACLALAGCASSGGSVVDAFKGGGGQADPATQTACRQRADAVYDRQNRGEIYSPQPGINTPSSGGYAPGDDSRGLGQIFARDRMIQDCVRINGISRDAGAAPVVVKTGKN